MLLLLLLLLLSRFSRVQLCATPETAAHQVPLSLGFSRQEHWSGLPFPPSRHMGNLKFSLTFPSPLASLSNQTPNSALLIPISELNLSPSCHDHCHNIISLQVCIIQFLTLSSAAPTSEAGSYCLKCNLKKKKERKKSNNLF